MNTVRKVQLARTPLGPVEFLPRSSGELKPPGTIVTIHGAMGGYDQSDILGRTIGPEGYDYLGISRPGYLGTPLRNNESPGAQGDLLAALLDSLGIDTVVVFAISGGGYSALHFCLRHPERCRGLVLCSTTGGPNSVPVPFAFNILKVVARVPFLLALMRKRAAARPEASLQKSISHADILDAMIQNRRVMALYRELSASTMSRMTQRLPGTMNDIRVTRHASYALGDIQVPTLVVHGTDDKVVPFAEHGARLAAEIPNARLCTAKRGEHAAIFSHNDQISAAVSDFLTSLQETLLQSNS